MHTTLPTSNIYDLTSSPIRPRQFIEHEFTENNKNWRHAHTHSKRTQKDSLKVKAFFFAYSLDANRRNALAIDQLVTECEAWMKIAIYRANLTKKRKAFALRINLASHLVFSVKWFSFISFLFWLHAHTCSTRLLVTFERQQSFIRKSVNISSPLKRIVRNSGLPTHSHREPYAWALHAVLQTPECWKPDWNRFNEFVRP